MASAEGYFCAPSWPACPAGWQAQSRSLLPPPQDTLPQGVYVRNYQREQKNQHHPEHVPAKLARQQRWFAISNDRPRVQEQQLDVEDKKEDRDQIKLDVKMLAGVADRVHPGLIGHQLDCRPPLRLEERQVGRQ